MSRPALPIRYRQILTVDAAREAVLAMLPPGCGLTISRVTSDEPMGQSRWFHRVTYSLAAGFHGQRRIEIDSPTPAKLVQLFEDNVLPQLDAASWIPGERFRGESLLPFGAVGQ